MQPCSVISEWGLSPRFWHGPGQRGTNLPLILGRGGGMVPVGIFSDSEEPTKCQTQYGLFLLTSINVVTIKLVSRHTAQNTLLLQANDSSYHSHFHEEHSSTPTHPSYTSNSEDAFQIIHSQVWRCSRCIKAVGCSNVIGWGEGGGVWTLHRIWG
jgi:hypothetical protein